MIPTMTYTRITQQSNGSHDTILFNRPCPAFRCNPRYCSRILKKTLMAVSFSPTPPSLPTLSREPPYPPSLHSPHPSLVPLPPPCTPHIPPSCLSPLRALPTSLPRASPPSLHSPHPSLVPLPPPCTPHIPPSCLSPLPALPTSLPCASPPFVQQGNNTVIRIRYGPLPAPRSPCSPHPPPVPPPYLRNFTVPLVATTITPVSLTATYGGQLASCHSTFPFSHPLSSATPPAPPPSA
ncbi:unnamed protein product [Closterium sp. NIES-65]|nr:unnamed protein product [Closterium sp. NIES-65]